MTRDMGVDFGVYSHYTLLGAVLARSNVLYHSYPILELGCGHGSTPLIHYAAHGREVVSVDTDPQWLKVFSSYENHTHRFVRVDEVLNAGTGISGWERAWKNLTLIDKGEWGVAFVDCWPGEVRVPIIKRLKGKAKFIVAHDCEADEPGGGGNYGWRKLDGYFKYTSTLKRIRPWTTVYSDDEMFSIDEVDSRALARC